MSTSSIRKALHRMCIQACELEGEVWAIRGGQKTDNPYLAVTDQHSAWKQGFDHGTKIAQRAEKAERVAHVVMVHDYDGGDERPYAVLVSMGKEQAGMAVTRITNFLNELQKKIGKPPCKVTIHMSDKEYSRWQKWDKRRSRLIEKCEWPFDVDLSYHMQAENFNPSAWFSIVPLPLV